ncbi:hypothetical protein Ndes2526B_g02091 [Nannochloris sp. 'desiccata']
MQQAAGAWQSPPNIPGRTGAAQPIQQQTNAPQTSAKKAQLEDNLSKLRTNLIEIEKDNWKYEAPRHSYN